MNECRFDVFISHNSKDKPAVRELVKKLKLRNIKYWLDEEQIMPGDSSIKKLEEGIENSKTAAVLIGKDGLGPWEIPEMEACLHLANEEGKLVMPVLLPGVPVKPKLPLLLRRFSWVDLRGGLDTNDFNRFVQAIKNNPSLNSPDINVSQSSSNKISNVSENLNATSNDKRKNEQAATSEALSTPEPPHLKTIALSGMALLLVLTVVFFVIQSSNEQVIQPVVLEKPLIVPEKTDEMPSKKLITLKVDPATADLFISINDSNLFPCNFPCELNQPIGTKIHYKAMLTGYDDKEGDLVVNVDVSDVISLEKKAE